MRPGAIQDIWELFWKSRAEFPECVEGIALGRVSCSVHSLVILRDRRQVEGRAIRQRFHAAQAFSVIRVIEGTTTAPSPDSQCRGLQIGAEAAG